MFGIGEAVGGLVSGLFSKDSGEKQANTTAGSQEVNITAEKGSTVIVGDASGQDAPNAVSSLGNRGTDTIGSAENTATPGNQGFNINVGFGQPTTT